LEELIKIIDEIIKYGLKSNIEVEHKEKDLEKNLVKLYSKYFEINFEYDDKEYGDFDKKKFSKVEENVRSNFNDFGWYHIILNVEKILEEPENATGDAIDDLSDIIYDLLQIKWRNETK
jgi:hypothetical protein